MTTTRPDSNTLQAEGDLEVHDAEQEKGTDVAMTKEERVDKVPSNEGLRKKDVGTTT